MPLVEIVPSGGNVMVPSGSVAGNRIIIGPEDPNIGIIGIWNGNVTPLVSLLPVQVVGLSPLMVCDEVECRSIDKTCCYVNPVFGVVHDGGGVMPDLPEEKATYENDFNTWLVDMSALAQSGSDTFVWSLEKLDSNGDWQVVVTPLTDTYGLEYRINTIPNHKYYIGFSINWGKVLYYQGVGCYRIKVNSVIYVIDPLTPVPKAIITSCMVSDCFDLKAWDCDRAHGTVKWETNATGKYGDFEVDYKFHDLCGITWYDSLRMRGFFGYEKVGEYLEVINEYQTGLQKKVRDEAIQMFIYNSFLLPKYIHDRFKTYGLMADTLQVSDYNENNSDYNIIQKSVIKSGGYEPKYHDKEYLQLQSVSVNFKRGVQMVIKTNCCDAVIGPSGLIDP